MKFIVGKSLYFLEQKRFYSPYLDIERKTKTSTKNVKKNCVFFCYFKRINDIFSFIGKNIEILNQIFYIIFLLTDL